MKLEAICEAWHIGDGNYPPFSVNDYVNLSFELEPNTIEKTSSKARYFKAVGNAVYEFSGEVIRRYQESDGSPLLVIETDAFRFYINTTQIKAYEQGDYIHGEGTLLLDHYIWVEFLSTYQNPPDLFYNLKVERIRQVKIPKTYIHRHARGKALPTRVVIGEINSEYIQDIKTMVDQTFDEEFYIVEFDTEGAENKTIPKTFL
jgi:hypothetical protein